MGNVTVPSGAPVPLHQGQSNMKVSMERSALLRAMSRAQSVVERRNTIPILSNVLIEAEGDTVSFRATDLDIEVIDRAPAMVTRTGAATVPAHTLHEIGGAEAHHVAFGLDQHVAEDRDGVAALHHRLRPAHGPEKGAALHAEFHCGHRCRGSSPRAHDGCAEADVTDLPRKGKRPRDRTHNRRATRRPAGNSPSGKD